VCGLDHGGDRALDPGRPVVGRVGHGEAAAEAVDGQVAEPGQDADGRAVGRRVVELGAEVEMEALHVEVRGRIGRERTRLARVEAELGLGVAGEDGGVRVGVHPGADPQQHPLARAVREHGGELGHVLVVVDHDASDARLDGRAQLVGGLRVAVQVDPGGLEPGLERQVQLAARGDVDAQSLLGEEAQHGRDGARLGGEDDLAVRAVVGLQRGAELARPAAQIVLRHHVRRRAELARQVDRVAPPEEEPAVLHGGRLGVDGVGGGGHDRAEA
jgi:hypothetical protein